MKGMIMQESGNYFVVYRVPDESVSRNSIRCDRFNEATDTFYYVFPREFPSSYNDMDIYEFVFDYDKEVHICDFCGRELGLSVGKCEGYCNVG